VETSSQRATAGARYIIYVYNTNGDRCVIDKLLIK